MSRKRFIIEMGTGVDQHGPDVTEAATRAVKDAVARVCLIGLLELIGLKELGAMQLEVLVACPRPDEVNSSLVLEALPFGQKRINVVEGGMIVHGHRAPNMGDTTDEIIVANAAVTVYVETDHMAMRG